MRFSYITDQSLPKGIRVWGAEYFGYTWVISYEPGFSQWSEEEKKEWQGYTASYRRKEHNLSSQIIRIEGGPWKTFKEAEEACKNVCRQLKLKN